MAPPHNAAQGVAFPFLAPFNTARNPAAAVPVGFHSDGLPLAIQIVGRRGDDLGVLRMSAAIEAMRPWADRWPALAEGRTDQHFAEAETCNQP